MNTFGKLEFTGKLWRFVQSDPEVRQRIRRLFVGARGQGDIIELPHTTPNTEDIEWIVDRYPHDADQHVLDILRRCAASAREARDLAALTLENAWQLPQPVELVLPLRAYQWQAVELTLLQQGLLLADVVGLGKTGSSIGLMVHPQARPALVVCKAHLQEQWRDEIKKFAPSLNVHTVATKARYKLPQHDVAIITYSKLEGWIDERCWKSVVYDECQELRRADSLKTKTATFIAKHMTYRMGLSATPVFNYAEEIHTILECISPGQLGTRSEFINEWRCGAKGSMPDPDALGDYLKKRNLILRRERKEVGRELPQTQTIVNMMAYDPKVLKKLRQECLNLAHMVLTGKFTQRGTAARTLDIKLRQATGIAKAAAVAEFVIELVKGGEKVLLGGWHREVYNVWNALFKKAGVKAAMYTGEENAKQKAATVKAFTTGDAQVMILSLRSGDGLNGLQDVCSIAVSGELDWTPKIHEQFVGRLARDGQTKGVTHFYSIMDNGSDPVIASLLGLKEHQSSAIVDPGKEKTNPLKGTEAPDELGRGQRLAQAWIDKHHGGDQSLITETDD